MTVRVLIVDDHAAFRRAAARAVARMPDFHVVGEAETGEASVEVAGRLAPDLVLMDVSLPGISGFEATRRILVQATGCDPRPVVLLLSTYEVTDYAAQAASCGSAGYLPKAEFGPAALRAAWLAAGGKPPG